MVRLEFTMQLCCVVVERNAWVGGVWGGGPQLWEDAVGVCHDLACTPPSFDTPATQYLFIPFMFNMKTIHRSMSSENVVLQVCETAWTLSCSLSTKKWLSLSVQNEIHTDSWTLPLPSKFFFAYISIIWNVVRRISGRDQSTVCKCVMQLLLNYANHQHFFYLD